MRRAYVAIREAPLYRREAFIDGLRAAGFEVKLGLPDDVRPDDVVVGWNRYEPNHSLAFRLEKAGGIYIAAENGYLLPGGGSPHDQPLREWFALAPSYHNDETAIPDGDASRWNALHVELQPWRVDGGHILICPNRSFGTPGRYMPPNWAEDVAARLKKLTTREVRIRPHPGNNPPTKPLADDLAGAWATVIWQSSAGVHSLVAGVPVICEAPFWICKGAAGLTDQVESPPLLDRLPHFHRLACAQFSLAEVQSGEAFDRVLRREPQGEVRAAD